MALVLKALNPMQYCCKALATRDCGKMRSSRSVSWLSPTMDRPCGRVLSMVLVGIFFMVL